MRRWISFFLVFLIVFSSTSFTEMVFAASTKTVEENWKISPLNQLGILDVSTPDAQISKQTLVNSIKKITNNVVNAEDTYFKDQDLTQPLRYGQALMVLIDFLGYTPYMSMRGYNIKNAKDYLIVAKKIGLISESSLSTNSILTTNDYAELLYTAVMEVPFHKAIGMNEENITYVINEGETPLKAYMKLKRVYGVVNLYSVSENDFSATLKDLEIRIGNTWYEHEFTDDMFEYFGRYVEAYVYEDKNTVKCLVPLERYNNILTVSSDDFTINDTLTYMNYYPENSNRAKSAKISSVQTFVFNRELVIAPKKVDFQQPDTTYVLIDNNDDNIYDVVIAEQFTSFIVHTASVQHNTITDIDGGIYDMEEYFKEGYRLYNNSGKPVNDLAALGRYYVVSYLKSKSGEMTYMIYSSEKVTGILDSMKQDKYWTSSGTLKTGNRYLTIDGVKYECTGKFLETFEPGYTVNGGLKKREALQTGDEVTAFFDHLGRIAEVEVNKPKKKAAFIFGYKPAEAFTNVMFRILTEDNEWKNVTLKDKVTLDGVRVNDEDVVKPNSVAQSQLIDSGGNLQKQLVIMNITSNDMVTMIDTAKDDRGLGKRGYDEFTLHYDSKYHASDPENPNPKLEYIMINGQKIAGTKYIMDQHCKSFMIFDTPDEEHSFVGNADKDNIYSQPAAQYFNVDNNYAPQYHVNYRSKRVNNWVETYPNCFMVDSVEETIDSNGDIKIRLNYYEPNGRLVYTMFDVDCKEQTSTPTGLTTLDKTTPLKDLTRGSVIMLKQDTLGAYAFSLHFNPYQRNAKGKEWDYFESAVSSGGNSALITSTDYEGSYLMTLARVVARTPLCFILNGTAPTDADTVFPKAEWNRMLPLLSSQVVLMYVKSEDKIYVDDIDSILPGDEILIKRNGNTVQSVYVYRD